MGPKTSEFGVSDHQNRSGWVRHFDFGAVEVAEPKIEPCSVNLPRFTPFLGQKRPPLVTLPALLQDLEARNQQELLMKKAVLKYLS